MLKAAYEEAKRLLSANRDALDKSAGFLIEKETITGKEFMKIFREVKGIPEPEEADGEKKEEQESGRILMKPTETQAAEPETEPSRGEVLRRFKQVLCRSQALFEEKPKKDCDPASRLESRAAR